MRSRAKTNANCVPAASQILIAGHFSPRPSGEMADTKDLGSFAARRAGSTPVSGTRTGENSEISIPKSSKIFRKIL